MKKKGISPQQAMVIREQKDIEKTKLQEARVKRGISQGELADATGVPKKTIQGYEQKRLHIDSAKLNTLCDISLALNCKVEDILESEELIEKLRKTAKSSKGRGKE